MSVLIASFLRGVCRFQPPSARVPPHVALSFLTTCLMTSAVSPISFFLRILSATRSPVCSSVPSRTLKQTAAAATAAATGQSHTATSQTIHATRHDTCLPYASMHVPLLLCDLLNPPFPSVSPTIHRPSLRVDIEERRERRGGEGRETAGANDGIGGKEWREAGERGKTTHASCWRCQRDRRREVAQVAVQETGELASLFLSSPFLAHLRRSLDQSTTRETHTQRARGMWA